MARRISSTKYMPKLRAQLRLLCDLLENTLENGIPDRDFGERGSRDAWVGERFKAIRSARKLLGKLEDLENG